MESPYTPGIDVSHYQGTIAWPRVKAAGIQFAFLKATDGTTGIDRMFHQNAEGCRLAGIPFGAYHFFRPDQPGQAEHFLETGAGDLPPVLDLEVGPLDLAQVSEWLETISEQCHVDPIVYCSPAFAMQWLTGSLAYPLWIADYTTAPVPQIAHWSDWEFWQYTPQGQVDGILTPVDLDWFHGSPEDLKTRFLSSS